MSNILELKYTTECTGHSCLFVKFDTEILKFVCVAEVLGEGTAVAGRDIGDGGCWDGFDEVGLIGCWEGCGSMDWDWDWEGCEDCKVCKDCAGSCGGGSGCWVRGEEDFVWVNSVGAIGDTTLDGWDGWGRTDGWIGSDGLLDCAEGNEGCAEVTCCSGGTGLAEWAIAVVGKDGWDGWICSTAFIGWVCWAVGWEVWTGKDNCEGWIWSTVFVGCDWLAVGVGWIVPGWIGKGCTDWFVEGTASADFVGVGCDWLLIIVVESACNWPLGVVDEEEDGGLTRVMVVDGDVAVGEDVVCEAFDGALAFFYK